MSIDFGSLMSAWGNLYAQKRQQEEREKQQKQQQMGTLGSLGGMALGAGITAATGGVGLPLYAAAMGLGSAAGGMAGTSMAGGGVSGQQALGLGQSLMGFGASMSKNNPMASVSTKSPDGLTTIKTSIPQSEVPSLMDSWDTQGASTIPASWTNKRSGQTYVNPDTFDYSKGSSPYVGSPGGPWKSDYQYTPAQYRNALDELRGVNKPTTAGDLPPGLLGIMPSIEAVEGELQTIPGRQKSRLGLDFLAKDTPEKYQYNQYGGAGQVGSQQVGGQREATNAMSYLQSQGVSNPTPEDIQYTIEFLRRGR